MVKSKIEVNRIIKAFAKELEKDIRVKQFILFGSYAKGTPHTYSDIDLVVVSPSFEKNKYIFNMQYLFRKAACVDSHIEPVPATPEEIKFADRRTFLGQIKKTGKIFRI